MSEIEFSQIQLKSLSLLIVLKCIAWWIWAKHFFYLISEYQGKDIFSRKLFLRDVDGDE